MTPLEILSRELSPEVAASAMRALISEAERIREARNAVRVMIVFYPIEAQQEPGWGCGIDTAAQSRYNDIHLPPPPL